VTGFAADWLALRRPADARAQDSGLRARLAAHLAGRDRLTVLDLGAGTGAGLALTAPHLPGPQHWRLVDDDPGLLARAVPPAGTTVERLSRDLSGGVGPLLDPVPDVVTAAAFFDIAGREWVASLAQALAATRVPLYATLIYDGRESWEPADPRDAHVLEAFHADQRRDKGLGPALGPDAPGALSALLAADGFAVAEARSDWALAAPRDAALIAALAEGSAAAVRPRLGADADRWLAARRGATRVRVGHRDILALPPA
jgi:hypothetical protein